MAVTAERAFRLCQLLKGVATREHLSLADYLGAIPKLDSLSDLPAGTTVLIRGDVDAKVGAEVGQGDIRLRSMVETIKFGQQKGFKQVVFGHLGRKEKDKPIGSLAKVTTRLGKLLDCEVTLIEDWLDESTSTVKDAVQKQIAAAPNGSVFVLQNVRGYDIETALWKAKPDALAAVAAKQATFADSLAEKIGEVYVNEALSAGSLDASSTVVPLAMSRVALGTYTAREFEGPMMECMQAQFVVFSGIKIDKLDDLEAMINRGKIKTIISAGSLAMALKKAEALVAGKEFCLGVTEDPAHADKPYYIPPDRIEQARRMLEAGKKQGIEFVLPCDFVLGDARVVETLQPGDQQFDIGPKTIALFDKKIGDFIASRKGQEASTVAFHNGVFGMFEDPRFEAGTKAFIGQLKRLTDAGIKVYVGGGEGGTALERYGQPNWVTHCFTAGGTVLNALGSEPVPYLVALRMAAQDA
ncbi:phosphoglycerate kinase [Anatilimnocola sp. NA78]|uniref:phosphoglycerate kinase n=1 Tax=Anatilimnocola sp. NA78 TaxID=3415683 RepID=UPI003CE50D6C